MERRARVSIERWETSAIGTENSGKFLNETTSTFITKLFSFFMNKELISRNDVTVSGMDAFRPNSDHFDDDGSEEDIEFDEANPWAWGQKQTKNSEGNPVFLGNASGSRGTLYCGQRREIPDTDGRCGPNSGNNCVACRDLQLRRVPRCGNNGHAMQIMEVRNYTCDQCGTSSSRSNLGFKRWRCHECDFDICFTCRPAECPFPPGYVRGQKHSVISFEPTNF